MWLYFQYSSSSFNFIKIHVQIIPISKFYKNQKAKSARSFLNCFADFKTESQQYHYGIKYQKIIAYKKLLSFRLISSEPNTYSYTKAITEDLVAEYSSKFPIAIGRPSIGE